MILRVRNNNDKNRKRLANTLFGYREAKSYIITLSDLHLSKISTRQVPFYWAVGSTKSGARKFKNMPNI